MAEVYYLVLTFTLQNEILIRIFSNYIIKIYLRRIKCPNIFISIYIMIIIVLLNSKFNWRIDFNSQCTVFTIFAFIRNDCIQNNNHLCVIEDFQSFFSFTFSKH